MRQAVGCWKRPTALRECLPHSTQRYYIVPQSHYIYFLSIYQEGMGIVCYVFALIDSKRC